jgi:hypothetical protein
MDVSASMASGTTYMFAYSIADAGGPSGVETNDQSTIQFNDNLTFSVAGGGSDTITFNFALDGTIGTDATFAGNAWTMVVEQNFGAGFMNWQSGAGVSSPDTNYTAGWNTFSFTNNTQTGFNFTGTLTVTNGEVVPIQFLQQIECGDGTISDFTAKVTLILPAGVTFTSDSGVFLKPAVPRDFAGDGLSGAVLYDPTLGQSYTALSNGNGTYQYVPNLFTPGFDILRTGDFNGDGKADLILYNSHTGIAYIGFGNGDGKTDVALYNSTTGTLYTGISNGDGTFNYQYHLVSMEFTFVALADFEGTGKAGLLLYNSQNGLSFLGVGDGTGNFTFNPLSISPGYNLAAVGDLNGDGKADILLYDVTNGKAATGISNGSGGFTFAPLIFSPGFTSVHLGNFTGSGKASATLYNKNTAAAYFGTGNGDGTFTFQSLFWSPGYDNVQTGDVNGDGKTDVILYNSTTGTQYTGLSNGVGIFNYTYWYWGLGKLLAQ